MFLDELEEAETEQLAYDKDEMGYSVPTGLISQPAVEAGVDTEDEDDGEEPGLYTILDDEDEEDES